MQENLTTKELIFNAATYLFAEKGYDAVSIKDIAKSVGIKSASIYNHFESKSSILDSIYDFFIEHGYDTRLKLYECEPILKTGNKLEIVGMLNYHLPEPTKIYFNIVRIIFSRIHIDPKAKKIYQEYIIENSISYIIEILTHGKNIGRINNSDEEIIKLAHLLLCVRTYSASSVVMFPNQEAWRFKEIDLIDHLSNLLSLNPPIESKQ